MGCWRVNPGWLQGRHILHLQYLLPLYSQFPVFEVSYVCILNIGKCKSSMSYYQYLSWELGIIFEELICCVLLYPPTYDLNRYALGVSFCLRPFLSTPITGPIPITHCFQEVCQLNLGSQVHTFALLDSNWELNQDCHQDQFMKALNAEQKNLFVFILQVLG